MLDKFFVTSSTPATPLLPVSYDHSLVAMSVIVAVISAILAMHTIGISRNDRTTAITQHIAILAGSCALGVGVWAMHFIGLLSMDICSPVGFDQETTLISILPALFSSAIALTLLARKHCTWRQVVIGGALIGGGIGIMHYLGMAAMQMAPLLRYEPLWFFISLLIAILLAIAAVWVRFDLANKDRISQPVSVIISGIILGLAISGMHYASMYGARFIGKATTESFRSLDHNLEVALMIASAAMIVSIVVLLGITFYRSLQMKFALSEREQQYRTLIANIPGVAFRCEAFGDWFMMFASDAITQVTGHDKQRFLKRHVSMVSLIHPDDLQRVRQVVNDALLTHRSYVLEYRIIHADGSERWISESAGGVYNDRFEPVWIDGVMIDITESKLRAAEHEGIVFAMRQALAVAEFDMNGYLLDANETFLNMMGYTLEELRWRHHRTLCHPNEADSQDYLDFWQSLTDGMFQRGEYCRLAKDGHEVWIQAAYNPILNSDGKPWKIVKLAIDLSFRKQMEKELIEARDRAEQAASAKGMFLANMSHEIRTPMNAIIGFTDVLLQSELSANQRQQLNTVSQAARSLLGLLNDILDTAKLERGAVELDPEDFSLFGLCTDLLRIYTVQAEKKGLSLRLEYDADCPPSVRGDALRIRQIITNLLGNAIKFTETGGVTLSVRHLHDLFEILITDTGIGIPQERLHRIFSPFTQADASMARRFGGTGLGTTIAHQLVQLMGGSIRVRSEVGKGSQFIIRLPIPASQTETTWQSTEKVQLPCLGILAVDDVAENLELLSLLLSKEGHQVTRASGGQEAIDQFQKGNFDIVLMDVQMPEMDGLTATRHIRDWELNHAHPAVPIIALTASVLAQDRQDATNAGMNGFTTKPIDLYALQLEMARVLDLLPHQQLTLPVAEPDNDQDTVLDWEGAVLRWGDRHVLSRMIHQFLRDYGQCAITLLDTPAVEQSAYAHKIKGVAANLGLKQIAHIASEIEKGTLLPELGAARLQTAITLLNEQLPAAETQVATPVAENSDTSYHWRDCKAPLSALRLACLQAQLDDAAMETLRLHLPEPILAPIEQAIDGFEFDDAVARIDALLQQCDQDDLPPTQEPLHE